MRYVQLRAFHHVALHGGFSRAAEALHLTQPAISDQVRKLESEYDVRLFDRRKKQVLLTKAGDKLLKITHRMFEVEQHAHEFLSESRALRTGTLKLMVDSTHHMLHILGAFRKKYPEVFVSIRVGNSNDVLSSLDSYEADVGVVGEIPKSREYESVLVSSTPIVAFAPKSSIFAKMKSITLKELSKHPLVLREPGSKTRAKLEEFAEKQKMSLAIKIEAEGREAVREIVASGGGIGIVSEAEFGYDQSLVKIPISGAVLTMDEALVCLRERQDSKLVRGFMELVKQSGKN